MGQTLYERLGGIDAITAVVEDLILSSAASRSLKVPGAEQKELMAILGPLKSEIVEVDSKEVGTAPPDAFRPAPA